MRAPFPNLASQRARAELRQPRATRKRQGRHAARLPVWSRPPAARSPPLVLPLSPSQPASQPGRALPRPLPLPSRPPPTSREQETRGPEEGDQVGEAMLGEGAMQPAAVYLTAAADASDALLAQPAPRILRLGVIWDQGTHKTTGVCEPPWGSRKKSCLASSVYAAPLSTETTGPRQPQSRYTSKS